ncbi:MAG: CIA30 family protein [Pseudomonadota bacterium]
MIDNFDKGAAAGWRFVSDRVMGGVSDGSVQYLTGSEGAFARLEGQVSTANNGGFIQFRRDINSAFPASSNGLKLRVRGNGQKYYVHLRPAEARRPWHFFQASFEAGPEWQNVKLDWSDFSPQGDTTMIFDQSMVTSIGIVAYGADYSAQVDVGQIDVE